MLNLYILYIYGMVNMSRFVVVFTCINVCSVFLSLYAICNELGGGRRRLYSDATDVGLSGSHQEQQNTPVMVYDDLMIRNNTVLGYNTNRSRPVTVQYIHKGWGSDRPTLQPYSDLGSDYRFVLPYGF